MNIVLCKTATAASNGMHTLILARSSRFWQSNVKLLYYDNA